MAWVWSGPFEPKQPRFLLQMGVTLAASMLTSLHLYLHDVSLLTLVICFAMRAKYEEDGTYGTWLSIPVAAWLLGWYGYLLAGINVLTPFMACLLVLMAARSRQRLHVAAMQSVPPLRQREPDAA